MDTIEFIRQLIAAARRQTDEAIKDMTREQFNWTPPGSANPISATFVHMLNSEDGIIQTRLQEKAKLWDEGGWSDKTGVKDTPGYSGHWEDFRHMNVALEPLLAYMQVVRAATDAYLDGLSEDALGRMVKFGSGERSVAGMMIHLATHATAHAGEIGGLRGVQTVRDLPA